MAVGLRYCNINLSPTNLPSNSTKHIKKVDTFVEESIDMQVDGKVIKMGSRMLIINQHLKSANDSDEIILVKDDGILPGADGFTADKNPRRCQNQNQCRNYGIFSRTATSAGTSLNYNANDAHFEPSLNSTFEKKQLQKKFEHAKDFGVLGNYNLANRDLFQRKLIEHMKSTHACLGTYRGKEVYHYYNPETKLNLMINRNNNKFISGWLLSPEQIANMERNGNIQ